MLRYVLLVALCAVGIANCELQTDIGVITVNDINEYLRLNPEATILETLDKNGMPRSQIRYTLGRRVSGMWKYIFLRISVTPDNNCSNCVDRRPSGCR